MVVPWWGLKREKGWTMCDPQHHTTKKYISRSSNCSIDGCRHSHYQAKQIPRMCVHSPFWPALFIPTFLPCPPSLRSFFFHCLLLDRTSFMYVFKRGGLGERGHTHSYWIAWCIFSFGFLLRSFLFFPSFLFLHFNCPTTCVPLFKPLHQGATKDTGNNANKENHLLYLFISR